MAAHYADQETWLPICRDADTPPRDGGRWTLKREHVTCPECLRLLAERERRALTG